MHRRLATQGLAALAAAGSLGALPAAAQSPPRETSALVRAVTECRGISEDAARLACYDSAAGRLETAERQGEVVIVDRDQARRARREAFGFNLPSLNVFARTEPDLEQVDLTVERARRDSTGKWVLRMQDGQVWRQVDNHDLRPPPRAGSRAEVRRGLLGAYFMNVDKERAIRVRREQ